MTLQYPPKSKPQRISSRVSNRYLYMNIQPSTIHNSQKGDAIYRSSMVQWINKLCYIHSYPSNNRFELHRSTYNWIFFSKYIL